MVFDFADGGVDLRSGDAFAVGVFLAADGAVVPHFRCNTDPDRCCQLLILYTE